MSGIIIGPSDCPIQVYAGDENLSPLEFVAGSDPWNITGAIITAQVRETATDSTVAMSAHIVITDGPNGIATMAWDGEEVRALLQGADNWSGVWDLQILAVGKTLPRTMLRGRWTAIMDITRTGP